MRTQEQTVTQQPELQDWEQTQISISEQAQLMDAIHSRYPGKENARLRDQLCQPHRAICVRLHYRRIELVRNMKAKR